MSLIRIDHNPPRRQLALFGLIWLVFFGVVGTIVLRRDSAAAACAIWTMAVAVPLIGWPLPRFMRIVYLGMSYATFPIGFVISHLILAVVYYLVLTPIGLLMRMLGHDPMQRGFDRKAETYWVARQQEEDTGRYFRQF